jgi:hypothetical protein
MGIACHMVRPTARDSTINATFAGGAVSRSQVRRVHGRSQIGTQRLIWRITAKSRSRLNGRFRSVPPPIVLIFEGPDITDCRNKPLARHLRLLLRLLQ